MLGVVPLQVGFEPLHGDAAGIGVVAVALQGFDDDEMQRRPAVGIGPLGRHAAEHELADRQRIGSGQAALVLETAQSL